MNAKAQALLDAQLHFIEQKLTSPESVKAEVFGFFDWSRQQNMINLCSSEIINTLAQKQVLATPLTESLLQQLEQHIQLVIFHPKNSDTTLADILPSETIDQIVQFIASKTEQRKQLIQKLVNNPSYVELIANIVQQSIKDYMDNSVVAKKVPGVGSIMKLGKAALERTTDFNIDDALNSYLHKNLNKLSSLSEKLINQHFDDDKLYQLQLKIWNGIKTTPLSEFQAHVNPEDVSHSVNMGGQVWDHIRQTAYLQAQVATGVKAWIERYAQETVATVLKDVNIDEELLHTELYAAITPALEHLIKDGYVLQRIRVHLEEFFASAEVDAILQ